MAPSLLPAIGSSITKPHSYTASSSSISTPLPPFSSLVGGRSNLSNNNNTGVHNSASTSLLSLNVHDALHFDGTPICLHPDLFPSFAPAAATAVPSSTDGSSYHSIGNSHASTVIASYPNPLLPSTTTTATATAATAPSGANVFGGLGLRNNGVSLATPTPVLGRTKHQHQQQHISLKPSMSSEDIGGHPSRTGSDPQTQALSPLETIDSSKNNTPLNLNSNNNNKQGEATGGLQVGDLIEIRVWDLLAKNTQPTASTTTSSSLKKNSTSNASSVMRRRLLQPSNSNETVVKVSSATSVASNPVNLSTTSSNYDDAEAPSVAVFLPIDPTNPPGSTVGVNSSDGMLQFEKGTSTTATTESLTPTIPSSPGPPTTKIISSSSSPASPQRCRSNTAETVPVRNMGTDMMMQGPSSPSSSSSSNLLQTGNAKNVANAPPPPLAPAIGTVTVSVSATLRKPPMQRRSTVTGVPPQPEVTTGPARQRANSRAAPEATASPSLHTRNISDMTIDTIVGLAKTDGTSAQNSAPNLPDRDPFPVAGLSDDFDDLDDEDTAWMTRILQTHQLRLSFIMLVTPQSLTSLKRGSTRTQVSILRQVADLYHLSSYDMVSVHRVTSSEDKQAALETASADFLLVTIKDQFISRGDMHFFQESLIGKWVYEGERLSEPTRGVQANAREIRHCQQRALSGIVTNQTLITFRSRSSRIIWLVQMSSEMWDYASPYENGTGADREECVCEIYFDKWIAFIHKLFVKWKELEATHSLTVVFFSRSLSVARSQDLNGENEASQYDVYGRPYKDHFRIVLENETGPDWDLLVVKIKEAFVNYPSEVGWHQSNSEDSFWPSAANKGNVLEAINVTLNLLQFHYLDRDLQRTGNSIVVISAGNGVFEVDRGLAGISYQRMVDNGIGSDVLSLGLPTLHIAPFFLYSQTKHLADLENASGQEQYYEIPHWMHLSFVSYQSDDAVFVDHLVEADDAKPDRALHDNKSGPVILSNGFLLSNTADPSRDADRSISPLLCAKSSTLLTDEKLLTDSHQRKLIDGRDFRDILEACRPRYAGTIPSALRAALNIDFGSFSSHNESMEQGASGSHGELEEWGTVHSDQMRTECGASATGQPATEERNDCVQLSVSPRNSFGSFDDGEDDRANDVSSHASSIASAMMYMSSDRSTYRELQVSPSTSIVELQRSNSLILDNGGDYVVLENGPSTNHIDESSILAERLRDMMRSHDENSINFSSLKSDVTFESIERDPGDSVKQQSGLTLRQRLIDGSHGASNGGLGFALSHFEQPTASWMTSATQGPSLSRTSSMIGTTRNIGVVSSRRMADLGSRGLSPMLLPSVVPTSYLHQTDTTSVALDTNRTSHGPMENRFINPQDYSKGRSIGFRPSARAFGAKSDTRLRAGTRSLSVSPPTSKSIGSPPRDTFHRPKPSHEERFQSKNNSPHNGSQPPFRAGMASRKKKMFNPFRQQDEEEVLAMKSHNRRRWSHVFPLGEIEFKRHAGPNWKSLTAPAILPISIDYFPNQEEIDREFTFSSYNVTLSEFDHKNYASNQDLYVEMVRQRLTQDFQVVSEDCINASLYRREKHPKGGSNGRVSSTDGTSHPQALRQFLSMGHRLHVITYDPSADMIEVYRYDDKDTQNNVTFDYHYLAFCQETKRYGKTRQTFSKYSAPYNWNKVDNIICGDDDREMREGMRFKRVMFGIIPEDFGGDLDVEEAYVLKFRRFLEYLEKLRDKEESITPLNVKFVTSADKLHQEESKRMESTPGVERNSMIRFYMQLRKGKRDNLEWMELAIDSTFDTSWSYRIMFNWLVASSGKVDAQVQLLQRRCSQFGLKLVPFPQITLSRNLYLNPFKAPAVLSIARNVGGLQLENVLSRLGFVHDGVFYTEVGAVLECMDNASLFNFQKVNERPILTPRMLPKLGHREKLTPLVEPISTRKKFCPVMGKQVVHRSGTLFVRVLTDLNGLCVLVVLGNYRYLTSSKEESLSDSYRSAFRSLVERISALEEHFFRDG